MFIRPFLRKGERGRIDSLSASVIEAGQKWIRPMNDNPQLPPLELSIVIPTFNERDNVQPLPVAAS